MTVNKLIVLGPGAVVESAGVRYVITHVLSLETVLAKEQATGKLVELKIATLIPGSVAPETKVETKELTAIDQTDWAAAEHCLNKMRPLLFARRTEAMVKAVA